MDVIDALIALIFFQVILNYFQMTEIYQISITGMTNEVITLQDKIYKLEKELTNAIIPVDQITSVNDTSIETVNEHEHRSFIAITNNWVWDVNLALELEELMENQSVGDFGAGLGCYGRFFLRNEYNSISDLSTSAEYCFFYYEPVHHYLKKPQRVARWKGYDAASFLTEASGGLVSYLDFSTPIVLNEKFDWVLSLETAEHIPENNEAVFVDNVASHACKGIVMSWSTPNGEGRQYLNSRPPEYIVHIMAQRNFFLDKVWSLRLKRKTTLWRLKSEIMVFTREVPLEDPYCSNRIVDYLQF